MDYINPINQVARLNPQFCHLFLPPHLLLLLLVDRHILQKGHDDVANENNVGHKGSQTAGNESIVSEHLGGEETGQR
jgi:hypothetical protein